ncbi:MAG: HAMP domain-containing protein [Desulfatitalea sp.]|nr:HAMP domain-containing protein [Desulfatitalea sp.]
MKKNGSSHIRKWLWFYVLAVVLTTLASYFFVYNEIATLLAQNTGAAIHSSSGSAITAMAPAELKSRILLLMSAGALAILLVSFIWLRVVTRKIQRPILTIRRALFRLAQGRLNETVTLESMDEFGQMGAKINELAANLQELLLCIWKQTGQCLTTLEKLQGDSEQRHKCTLPAQTNEQLQQVTASIENLREMAKAYVFYDVRLDGGQTVAINEPGQKKSASTTSM